MIRCPVCQEALTLFNKSYQCCNHHTFDVAKQGYVNLLLHQKPAGDNLLMVKARRQVMASGVFNPLMEAVTSLVASINPKFVCDVGCGEGTFMRALPSHIPHKFGIDISKVAISEASKRDKQALYLVASNYHLPFFHQSMDCLVNIIAPHAEEEFSRVCSQTIVKVVPGRDHLKEMKMALYETVQYHDPKKVEFPGFYLKNETRIHYQALCHDPMTLIQMTPYFYTTPDLSSKPLTSPMLTTFDFIIYHYEREVTS